MEIAAARLLRTTPHPGPLELWQRTPIRAGRGTTTGRALLECRPVQIPDVQADPEYDFPEAQKLQGHRTVLAVPLMRDGVPLGTIGLWKTEKPPAAIGERTQVAVRLQRQPRAAHAAQRHHWTDRDDGQKRG